MVTSSQKSTAPVTSPHAKANQPAVCATPPVTPAHPPPQSGGPDPTCFMHRLEEALQLVESMQLASDWKTEIAQ